jgi:acyl-coenzyme A synthetase/AMP-(fatty) acid ligase
MSDSLFHLWSATVERDPGATAVIEAESGKKWSRAALAAGAAEWAYSFREAVDGAILVRRRVAMSVPNGAEWFRIFIGLLSVGAVPAPFDPSEPEDAQADAARAIGASYLWREGRLLPIGRGRPTRVPRTECLVKMTSASTGAPRGLAAGHAQMEADGRQICASMGIVPADACLAAIPLGYSYGLGNLVLPLILQGTRVICASSALPQALATDAARFRPTVFPAVPPVLKALASSDLPGRALSSLRLVISAGSALAPDVARAFSEKFGRRIHGFYGTSETGGIAFDRTGEATLEGRSVGTPLEGVILRPSKSGRFTVSSAAVLGRGRFSPADRASFGTGGELVLLGRTDRVVKVAGRRVDLAEIERALRALPGIRDAFAHLVPGPELVLAAAAATTLAPPEIRRLLRSSLASWKVPTRVVVLAQFPVTARGKTDGRRLRQLLSAPRTATSISTLSAARQMSAPR